MRISTFRDVRRSTGPQFRTIARGTGQPSDTPLPQATVYAKVQFRTTDITAYPAKVNHAATRTTQLSTGITRASALTRWSGFMRSSDGVL